MLRYMGDRNHRLTVEAERDEGLPGHLPRHDAHAERPQNRAGARRPDQAELQGLLRRASAHGFSLLDARAIEDRGKAA
jgi:hypothetical protein